MRRTQSGVEMFLQAVSRGAEQGRLDNIQRLRQHKGYECLTALELAVHLILELHDEASSIQANVARICSNLEMEADQLMHLSKRIRGLV